MAEAREPRTDRDGGEEAKGPRPVLRETPEPPSGLVSRFPALERLGFRGQRRIPYVQQTASADCGSACLTMVLAYWGKELRLDEVREIAGFGRDGADALALLKAGRWFGLRGRGLKVEDVADLSLLPRASILHWRFNHFVVLDRVEGEWVHVVDPGGGRRRISLEEVGRNFTGVAIPFEPGEGFEPGVSERPTLHRWIGEILSHTRTLTRTLVTSVLLQVFALAVPFLIGILVDRVVPRGDRHLLLVVAVGLAGLVGFYFLTTMIRAHLLLQLRTQIDARMTLDFLDHLVDLPYAFFQKRSAGDLMMRLNSNQTIREILTQSALSGVLDGTLVVLYLVLLFIASWKIGLLVLGLGAILVTLFLLTRRRQRDLMSESLQAQAELQNYQVQLLAGIETLKATGSEHRSVERWSNLYVDVLNVSLQRGRLDAWVEAVQGAVRVGAPLAVLLYGGLLVLRGDLSLGVMLALNALAVGFLTPLSTLVSTAFQLQLMGSYLERVQDVMDQEREQAREGLVPAGRLRGGIRLEDVSFRYGPHTPLVVQDVSVEIEPGQFVAIVGRSGAGKSTLAGLLLGLYVPTAGKIYYDGHDLAQMDLRSVRQQLGIVPQTPFLFGGSIRANIALSDPGLPLSRVVEAAQLAHVHREVLAMPMGYETPVADGGGSLSGGQRQRMALARALVQRPAILLLDEATSSLDTVTEAAIHRELGQLRNTRLVIAHRLSTVRDADVILVMDDGRLVEKGTHAELLDRGGHYSRLVAAQVERGDVLDLGERAEGAA
jgi:ATP-binding cassette, subfamily B, bacterial